MTRPPRQKTLPGMDPTPDHSPSPAESPSDPSTPDLPLSDAIDQSVAEPPSQPQPDPTSADEPATACHASPPDSLQGKTVYVIDSHSLIYQVFHAMREMTGPRGEPVGALFGFTRDLFYLLQQKRPDYLFCAFDMPGKTFRHDLFDNYKINRAAMPDDLIPQIDSIRRVLQAMGIPAVGLESFEADDILATFARVVDELHGHCYLVTNDKDCRQLITDRVSVYNIRKDQVFEQQALSDEWGIAPGQVVDFQSLVGDSVDNVPGVPLIGPKIARELLQQYGTLESVLDHAHEVSGKKRKQNLIDGRDQAFLSRALVKLDSHVPIDVDFNAGRVAGLDGPKLAELFREFGFHSLLDKLDSFDSGPVRQTPKVTAQYHLVDTPQAFDAFLERLSRQKCFSLDTETRNISQQWSSKVWPRWAEIVGLSFAWQDDQAWYLPIRGPQGDRCLDPHATLESVRPILEDPNVGKIGQNLKYEMIVLRSAGIELAGLEFDTMVASYLLEAGDRNHGLDELAKRYLDHDTIKITQLIGTGKNQKRMDEVPVAQVADYAAEDALLPWLLRPLLQKQLRETGLESLCAELELPLISVLAELEYNGISVDTGRLAQLSLQHAERLETLQSEIFELAGHEFNIASPKQLQKVLFEEQGLPVVKRTKTGPSTDAGVLEDLAQLHDLPAKIIDFRQVAKLKGTYVDALPDMVHPTTRRVHASFNQGVTATGRLSSSDPNLQNIPVRSEAGREIRSAFVPGREDWVLLAADYSQIELRVLAHFSGDKRLFEAFANGEDIHARVAGQVHGVELSEVTPEMRRKAKAVNFGVIYGQSPFGLAKQLRIDPDEAAQFIDAYFDGYPRIEGFLDQVLADCRKNGYVETILGRRRRISGVRADPGRQKNLAERTAVNTVIQGSAADLIKQAMVRIHGRIAQERLQTRMLLQIHDELIFEVPVQNLDDLAQLVVSEMVSGVQPLSVPLVVDLKVGPNWADAKPRH
jgi:DNA polymerase I